MEPVYIVMICAAALFALLLLAYFMRADVQRKLAERKEEELEKAYSDENLKKMEYDVAVYDEETRKRLRPAADPAAGRRRFNFRFEPEQASEFSLPQYFRPRWRRSLRDRR